VSNQANDGWEVVHTVDDVYDGPRSGVADFQGTPHAYRNVWDYDADRWEETFQLKPIEAEQLEVVMEAWAIWRRWKAAHDAGALGAHDHHPALAVDRSRREELDPFVSSYLAIDPANAMRAIPEFRGQMDPSHTLQVRWTIP
jgi:hypothetical protein